MTSIRGDKNSGKLNKFSKDTWTITWNGRFLDLLFQNCAFYETHGVNDLTRNKKFTTYFHTMWKSRKEPTTYWDSRAILWLIMTLGRELVVLVTNLPRLVSFCKQNNQLPTKSHDELKDNSNMHVFMTTTCCDVCCIIKWRRQILHLNSLYLRRYNYRFAKGCDCPSPY